MFGAPQVPQGGAFAGSQLGGILPAYIGWAQRQARINSALGRTTPGYVNSAAELPFVGPKAGLEAGGKFPYDAALKNLEATNALRNALAEKGWVYGQNGQMSRIPGFSQPMLVGPGASVYDPFAAQGGGQPQGAGTASGQGSPAGVMYMNPNSAALVNLNQGQESHYRQTTGTKLGDLMATVQSEGTDAAAALRQLNEVRGALNNLPTGPGATTLNEASAALQRVGVDINRFLPEGLSTDPVKAQVATKNINELAMALAKSNFPGGRITNNDLDMAIRSTPNFFNVPGANKQLLDNIEAIQRLKVEKAQFFRAWARNHDGDLDYQAMDDWANHVQKVPNIPPLIKDGMMSFSDLLNRPSPLGNAGQMNLPPGAVNVGKRADGTVIYLYPNKNGAQGYYTGDERGNPVGR
jgi:hypothetical protein